MQLVVTIAHIIVSVSLVGLILLQSSKGGFANQSGGEFYRTKRGAERVVFSATIILAFLFLLTSIISITVR